MYTYYVALLKTGTYDVFSKRECWDKREIVGRVHTVRANNIVEADRAGRQLIPYIRLGLT